MVAIWFNLENFSLMDHAAKNDTKDLISLSNCNPPNRLNLDFDVAFSKEKRSKDLV